MKKIIITDLAILLLTTSFLSAGAQTTIEQFKKMPLQQKARLITDSLKVGLNLTSVQYVKVYSEVVNLLQKGSPIAESDDSRFSKGRQLRTILSGEEVKLQSILTAAQFDLYKSKKEKLISYYRSHLEYEKIIFTVPG